jgi:S1-C subfamily serine protease
MHRFFKLVPALVLVAWGHAGWAAEGTWSLRADFVGTKPGNPAVAIFQLPDKTRIELPLAALSDGDREAIRRAVEAKPESAPGGALTIRGPLGRSVTLAVPEVLKAVETDAVWCSTAADAVLVYQLFLAGDALSAAERAAAEKRLAEWQKLASEKRVRQGEAWVTPEQRAAVCREVESAIRKALQTLKLGNTKLFEDELEKASRLDPEDGRAEFILGLGWAMSPGGAPKAIEHFGEAARRAPEDPWVFTNLAACEFVAGRFGSLPARYRQAFDHATDGRLVTANLGAMLAAVAATRSNKMPERTVRELNDLYHRVTQATGVKPGEGAAGSAGPGIAYASPYGAALPQVPVAGLPALLEPPDQWVAGGRFASGVVVSPGLVLTCGRVRAELGEVWVEDPATPGRRLEATEVASLEDPEVTLLKCDGLVAAPLPLGDKMPVVAAEVAAANKAGGLLLGEPAEVRRGALVSGPRTDLRGAFVHSAKLTRGLGGGPIVDVTGRVVGLVAPTPRTDATGNGRGLGIPIEAIWPLLKEQLADLAPAEAAASPLAWEAVEARLAPATVRVVGVEKRVRPKAE